MEPRRVDKVKLPEQSLTEMMGKVYTAHTNLKMKEAGVETVVACTGRCGSTYLSKLLNELGITAAHEVFHRPSYTVEYNCKARIQRVGMVMEDPWPPFEKIDVEVSPFAAPFIRDFPGRVIHLVRNPLHVIRSWYADGERWGFPYQQYWLEKLFDFVPLWPQIHQPYWYAEMYCRWNWMIEQLRPDAVRVRIEDCPRALTPLFDVTIPGHLETKPGVNSTNWLMDVKLDDITIWDVRDRVKRCMERYGYADDS